MRREYVVEWLTTTVRNSNRFTTRSAMKLDLREDFKDIYSYLVDRVRTYDPSKNHGPGPGNSPISQIEIGYQYDQAGWVALVFDTRPDAKPDGEWNSYIEQNIFDRPHWQEAFESLETEPLEIVLPEGSTREISDDTDEVECAAIFGELLKKVLLKARDDGVLKSLPRIKDCHMGVEEQDGHYGWPNFDDRGKEDLA